MTDKIETGEKAPNLVKKKFTEKQGPRKKTYKREFTGGTFVACLGWGMFSGDTSFLETTFVPTLAAVCSALGLHEITENVAKRDKVKYEEGWE